MDFLNLLAQYRTPLGDAFFQAITLLAQETFVVVVICWLFWCSNKKLAYCLGFTYFSSGLLVQGLKITFRVPRPWLLDPNFQPVASAVPGATGYSFPSGHTQSITALLGTLGFYTKKKPLRFLCFLFVFLVGFSRMYLGCHTPQDVLVSFGVSIVCVFLCYHFLYKKEYFKNRESLVSVFMGIVCVVLLGYTLFLYKSGAIEFHYAQDCIKACGAGGCFFIGILPYGNLYSLYAAGLLPGTGSTFYHRYCCNSAFAGRLKTNHRPEPCRFLYPVLPCCFLDHYRISLCLLQKRQENFWNAEQIIEIIYSRNRPRVGLPSGRFYY